MDYYRQDIAENENANATAVTDEDGPEGTGGRTVIVISDSEDENATANDEVLDYSSSNEEFFTRYNYQVDYETGERVTPSLIPCLSPSFLVITPRSHAYLQQTENEQGDVSTTVSVYVWEIIFQFIRAPMDVYCLSHTCVTFRAIIMKSFVNYNTTLRAISSVSSIPVTSAPTNPDLVRNSYKQVLSLKAIIQGTDEEPANDYFQTDSATILVKMDENDEIGHYLPAKFDVDEMSLLHPRNIRQPHPAYPAHLNQEILAILHDTESIQRPEHGMRCKSVVVPEIACSMFLAVRTFDRLLSEMETVECRFSQAKSTKKIVGRIRDPAERALSELKRLSDMSRLVELRDKINDEMRSIKRHYNDRLVPWSRASLDSISRGVPFDYDEWSRVWPLIDITIPSPKKRESRCGYYHSRIRAAKRNLSKISDKKDKVKKQKLGFSRLDGLRDEIERVGDSMPLRRRLIDQFEQTQIRQRYPRPAYYDHHGKRRKTSPSDSSPDSHPHPNSPVEYIDVDEEQEQEQVESEETEYKNDYDREPQEQQGTTTGEDE